MQMSKKTSIKRIFIRLNLLRVNKFQVLFNEKSTDTWRILQCAVTAFGFIIISVIMLYDID